MARDCCCWGDGGYHYYNGQRTTANGPDTGQGRPRPGTHTGTCIIHEFLHLSITWCVRVSRLTPCSCRIVLHYGTYR